MRAKLRRLDRTFRRAAVDHQTGRLAEAERGYRDILGEVPDHADALHGLGLLALQCERPSLAVAYLGKAARAAPSTTKTVAMMH